MYRILTEDINRESIYGILDSHVDGYTVTPSIGSWRGQRERSLAIDLVDVPRDTVEKIAKVIRWENQQESVLIIELPSNHTFIGRDAGIWQVDGSQLTRKGNPR